MKESPVHPSLIGPTIVRRPFGPLFDIRFVSEHAMTRFRERANVKGTEGEVMKKLEEWVKQSKPARLKPPHNVIKLLNNGFRPATYRCFGSIKRRKGWIFVIEGGTIITLHKHDSGEWELEGEGN